MESFVIRHETKLHKLNTLEKNEKEGYPQECKKNQCYYWREVKEHDNTESESQMGSLGKPM